MNNRKLREVELIISQFLISVSFICLMVAVWQMKMTAFKFVIKFIVFILIRLVDRAGMV